MPALDPVEVYNGPLMAPDGRPLRRAAVPIRAVVPSNPLLLNGSGEVLAQVTPDTDLTGIWRVRLVPTSAFMRRDAYYTADERKWGGEVWMFRVPDAGGPYNLADLLITEPPVGDDPTDPGAGASTYMHVQDVVSDTWVVNHGLGRRPVAWSLYDEADHERDTYLVSHPDLNRCVVTMDVPTAGTLYLI